MTPIVFKILVLGVEIQINGTWEKHHTRQEIDLVGAALAYQLGGDFLHFIEQGGKG